MNKLTERFLRYVKFNTASDENSDSTPSTAGQIDFAKHLVEELKELGLKEVEIDNNGYVMALLPANTEKDIPTIGFIAHLDTAPGMTGDNINPCIFESYNGEDIVLNKERNIILSTREFPEIKDYLDQTLITTDGNTLLGADDKAGIAEIITAMEYLINHPEIKHGNIRIAFTPDEEIGRGANHFDVDKFNAKFAYTVDGGAIGELEYENFNAAGVNATFKGRNVHPGSAKDKMINSMLIALEFIAALPPQETPANTDGYDGFYHLTSFIGDVEETKLQLIIRDFSMKGFHHRKSYIENLAVSLADKYGKQSVNIDLEDQYYNMQEKIEPQMHIIDTAFEAMSSVGIEPKVKPIRGGTDGARLSYMGLPTPNIFTGGHNFHSRYEFVVVESMAKAVETIVAIAKLYAEK